jgi:hypothetical protein
VIANNVDTERKFRQGDKKTFSACKYCRVMDSEDDKHSQHRNIVVAYIFYLVPNDKIYTQNVKYTI